MKKNIALICGLVLIIAGIAGFVVYAVADNEKKETTETQADTPRQYPVRKYRKLSEEDRNKIMAERKAFYEETKELRKSIREKETELRGEIAKPEPDVKKAKKIQAEINVLQAQYNLIRVEHLIREKKINPDAGSGMMMMDRQDRQETGPKEKAKGKHGKQGMKGPQAQEPQASEE